LQIQEVIKEEAFVEEVLELEEAFMEEEEGTMK